MRHIVRHCAAESTNHGVFRFPNKLVKPSKSHAFLPHQPQGSTADTCTADTSEVYVHYMWETTLPPCHLYYIENITSRGNHKIIQNVREHPPTPAPAWGDQPTAAWKKRAQSSSSVTPSLQFNNHPRYRKKKKGAHHSLRFFKRQKDRRRCCWVCVCTYFGVPVVCMHVLHTIT